MQLQIFNKLEDLSISLFVLFNNDMKLSNVAKRVFYDLNQKNQQLCQNISEPAFKLPYFCNVFSM